MQPQARPGQTGLRNCDTEMEQARQDLAEEIFFQKFIQFECFRQWAELKSYANAQKIRNIEELAIYVAHNSADVWAHPEVFKLDPESGYPAEMAGVPPDYFSDTVQLWLTLFMTGLLGIY
jgi:4-alpha-glucanotransferase